MAETSSREISVCSGGSRPTVREIQANLAAAASALDQGDAEAATEILAAIPLDACGVGLLARTARLAKRAGAVDLWVRAGQLCVERYPQSPDGYMALLGDVEIFIADPAHRAMGVVVATAALEVLASGAVVSPALAFHVNRVIDRFSGDRALTVRSQHVADRIFTASGDGAVWQARDLLRRGELAGAARVLDTHVADLDGPPSDDLLLVRGKIALAEGRWGRDWVHLQALGQLRTPVALKLRSDLDDVRALFTDLGLSFDDGPSTPAFAAISSPESAAEVICRVPTNGRTAPANASRGLLLAGGSLSAGGAERLMAICFREFRNRDVLGNVDLAIMGAERRSDHDDPYFFLPLTGIAESDLVRLGSAPAVARPFSYFRGGLGQRAQAWYDILSDRRPQVVHAWLDYTMLTAGLAGVRAGVPKILLHSHNMRPESLVDEGGGASAQWRERGRGWKAIYAQLLSRPEVHFVNCSAVATQDYLDWIEVDASAVNAHTIHNGLDFAPFDEDGSAVAAELRATLGIPDGAPVVGTALRFSAVKQPDHWVEAAIQIRRAVPDAHFVMFGDGADRAELMAKIEAAGAAGYIHCPGRFSDIHLRLALLDVFMLSSRSEGLPNVLVESQARGVPVVAYDVGGVRETFVDGVTGTLVRDKNPAALAAAVVSALRSPEWRLAAGEAGKRFVRREFGIDKMVTRLEALITE